MVVVAALLVGEACTIEIAEQLRRSCGNGRIDAGEVCDDGNHVNGDGCSANCRSQESCGNGIVDPGETCDDGNQASGDGCSANCGSQESCSNGIIDPGETCDDGNQVSGDGCSADCRSWEVCGNGVVDMGEVCDDGNLSDGDECSAACRLTSPIAITAGLHLWLRADVGVLSPDGDHVARWSDQSGNGRDASMALPVRQPQRVAGALNGLPVLRFGGAQSMYLDRFATPTTFTVFVVGRRQDQRDDFDMILGPGGSSPNHQLRWQNTGQLLLVGFAWLQPIVSIPIGSPDDVYHMLTIRYDGSILAVSRDGGAPSTSRLTTSGAWTLASIGSWYSSHFLRGDLAEIVIYERALSAPEERMVTAYLRQKYHLP
jgi:cysteine-rich repeat protein